MKTKTPSTPFLVRQAGLVDGTVVAENFYKMWKDYGLDELLREDWQEITLQFIEQAKTSLSFAAFIAEANDQIIGSVACQRFSGLYPDVFEQSERNYGYIWGVYVSPQYRGRGVGKTLTETADDYLRSIGCTRVLLHASPMGRSIYTSLGFIDSNEMGLDFIQ